MSKLSLYEVVFEGKKYEDICSNCIHKDVCLVRSINYDDEGKCAIREGKEERNYEDT